jgi:hypothetical protein
VNGSSRAKEKSFALLEPVTPQEAAHTRERRLREEAPFAHDSTVLTFQDCGH